MCVGAKMYELCRELFPICRSISGAGLRKSLEILKREAPRLTKIEFPTGTNCFDWEIPMEWNIRDAFIVAPDGKKLCRFTDSNLHVMGYSTPIDREVQLEELQEHLYSLPDNPDAIPYVTSYYRPNWGFCITHKEREGLIQGKYRVFIDSTLSSGSISAGELVIEGESDQEVLLSTYLCHPSMANNELSGPVVTTFLAKWLDGLEKRRYTYRILFLPETIGSIAYLSRNHATMKQKTVAGFVITCVGDDKTYSYLPSRKGNTLADRAAKHVLKHHYPEYKSYSYLDRGSDERQYCSPGIDLPVCSVMRSKYGTFPEYHTSHDNLDLVSPEGLSGSYDLLKKIVQCIEANETVMTTVLCEPQLGKRGLYSTTSTRDSWKQSRNMVNLVAYADGTVDLIGIAEAIGVALNDLTESVILLKAAGLLKLAE